MSTRLKSKAYPFMFQYPTPALEEQLTFLLNQSELFLDNRTRTTSAQSKTATAQHNKNQPPKNQQNTNTKIIDPQRQHPTTMVQKSYALEQKGAAYNSKTGPHTSLEYVPLFDLVKPQVSTESQLNVPIPNHPLNIIRASIEKLLFSLQETMISNAEVAHELITSILELMWKLAETLILASIAFIATQVAGINISREERKTTQSSRRRARRRKSKTTPFRIVVGLMWRLVETLILASTALPIMKVIGVNITKKVRGTTQSTRRRAMRRKCKTTPRRIVSFARSYSLRCRCLRRRPGGPPTLEGALFAETLQRTVYTMRLTYYIMRYANYTTQLNKHHKYNEHPALAITPTLHRPLMETEQFLGSSRCNCDEGDGPIPSSSAPRKQFQDFSETFPSTKIRWSQSKKHQNSILSIITLNLDGAMPGKSEHYDAMFRQLNELNIHGLLLQDLRCDDTTFRQLLHSARTYLYQSEQLPVYIHSMAPLSPNNQRYGGTAIILPPHFRNRIVNPITDHRNLGRYCALTIRGRRGSNLTLFSAYFNPAPGNENGVHATQQRYLKRLNIDTDPNDIYIKDISSHLNNERSQGNEILLGADFQTNIRYLNMPATQRIWQHFRTTGLTDLALDYPDSEQNTPTYHKGAHATCIDGILATRAVAQYNVLKYGTFSKWERLNNSDHRAVFVSIDINRLLDLSPPPKIVDLPHLRHRKIHAAKLLLKGGPQHQPLAKSFKEDIAVEYTKQYEMSKANSDAERLLELDALLLASADKITAKFKRTRKRKLGWCPQILQLRQAASWIDKRIALFEAIIDAKSHTTHTKRARSWLNAAFKGKVAITMDLAYNDGLASWRGLPTNTKALLAPPPSILNKSPQEAKRSWCAWINTIREQQKEVRKQLRTKNRSETRMNLNNKTKLREQKRLEGQTQNIFERLLGNKKNGSKDIVTIGDQPNLRRLIQAEDIKKEFNTHFQKHFGHKRQKWYITPNGETHPFFRMDEAGRVLRKNVVAGNTADLDFPEVFRNLIDAFSLKKIEGQSINSDIYTEHLVNENGQLRPIEKEEWLEYWRKVPKAKASGKSGITTDMLALASEEMLVEYLVIINRIISGGPIPEYWKKEVMFPTEKIPGTIKIEKHRPIMLLEVLRKACTGFMVQRLRKTWTKHHIISGKNTGFTSKKSTAEPILKLRTCLDNAHKYKRPLYLNGEDLSKAFDTPERAVKELALMRLGVPQAAIDFLGRFDIDNEVHILTGHGLTTEGEGSQLPFEAECGVKQGSPEGPFIWLAINDIIWSWMDKTNGDNPDPYDKTGLKVNKEELGYEYNDGGTAFFTSLLAFVDDGIYLNSSWQARQLTLNHTSILYAMLGLDRNGSKCFETASNGEEPQIKPFMLTYHYRGRSATLLQNATATDHMDRTTQLQRGIQIWVLKAGQGSEKITIRLPDNSVWEMNAHTQLDYTSDSLWQVFPKEEPLEHVDPTKPIRQLGVYFSATGNCNHQLEHIKDKLAEELATLSSRQATFAEAELVAHMALETQVLYGLRFTTISEAKIAKAMATTRTAVLHKAKVATTEPRNLTGAPEFIHGLGIRNWEVANITNKIETLLKIITTEASVRGSLIGELESVRHRLGFGHARRLADIVQSPTWSELVYLEAKKI